MRLDCERASLCFGMPAEGFEAVVETAGGGVDRLASEGMFWRDLRRSAAEVGACVGGCAGVGTDGGMPPMPAARSCSSSELAEEGAPFGAATGLLGDGMDVGKFCSAGNAACSWGVLGFWPLTVDRRRASSAPGANVG